MILIGLQASRIMPRSNMPSSQCLLLDYSKVKDVVVYFCSLRLLTDNHYTRRDGPSCLGTDRGQNASVHLSDEVGSHEERE